MTADLHGSCAALAVLLPAARALTAEPGTGAASGRVPPSSRPPWDSAAANAVMDAHAGVRYAEIVMRVAAGLPVRRRGGSDANTLAAIRAMEALANAVTDATVAEAARFIDGLCRPIEQLPAIDKDEPARMLSGVECPYCSFGMLAVRPREGKVTCVRYGRGLCPGDQEGHHPIGHMDVSRFTGDPCIRWNDGRVTP